MGRRYRHVIAAVFGTEWAIMADKLELITELLHMRAQGVTLTPEQIKARVGTVHAPALQEHAGPRVAMLNLFGTISQRANAFSEFSGGTSTEQFAKAFDAAVADESVSSIVINVDSPGGAVPGVPELAQRIYEARGKKRIVAVANPVMASAAYWIASAADEIVAIPSASDIGSIGVLAIHTDQTEMDEKIGVKHTLIRSTDFKAEGNPHEPLTEAARDHFEQRVGSIHEEFVAAVAKHRNVNVSTVESQFGKGRTFRAQAALNAGMVDRVATLESVLTDLGAAATEPSIAAVSPQTPVRSESPMSRKVKLALVQAGLCKATDTDEAFAAALSLAVENADGMTDDQIVASIKGTPEPAAAAPQPSPAPKAGGSSMTVQELTKTIQMSSLPAERKIELIGELSGQLESMSLSDVLNRINESEQTSNPPAGAVAAAVTANATDKLREAARDAVLVRHYGSANLPSQILDTASGELVDWKPTSVRNYGLSNLPKLAEALLIQSGVPYEKVASLPPMQLAQLVMGAPSASLGIYAGDGPAYNVSGMFSNILLDAANVILRNSYMDARTTFQMWMRQGPSVADFKTVNKVIAGELSDPRAVPEDGEFEESTLSDGKETYRLTTWGSVFSHSWQLVVNDRLNSFTEIPQKLGRAMRRKQNRLAYAVLKDNNALVADSVALFHAASHTNLQAGAVTNYHTEWNTMARDMAQQTGLDSDSGTLNLAPEFVIFPPALRGSIREAIGSPANVNTSGHSGIVNIWQQGLTPIEEGELNSSTTNGSDTAFYLAANSNDVDTVEYAYLQGLEAPVIEQETAFDRLALRQRIYQAFAVAALDYRGLQKHAGV